MWVYVGVCWKRANLSAVCIWKNLVIHGRGLSLRGNPLLFIVMEIQKQKISLNSDNFAFGSDNFSQICRVPT